MALSNIIPSRKVSLLSTAAAISSLVGVQSVSGVLPVKAIQLQIGVSFLFCMGSSGLRKDKCQLNIFKTWRYPRNRTEPEKSTLITAGNVSAIGRPSAAPNVTPA